MSNKIELDIPHWGKGSALAVWHTPTCNCKLDQFHEYSEFGVLVDFKTGLLKIKPYLVHLWGDKEEINQDP